MAETFADVIETHAPEIERRFVTANRLGGAAESLPYRTLADSVRLFLAELVAVLRHPEAPLQRSRSATHHGAERFSIGYDVGKLVREYSLLREILFDLAEEKGLTLTILEQRIAARFFFNGVADAATAYGNSRDSELQEQAQKHLAFLAHELRNPLATAKLAMSVALRGGTLPKTRIVDSVSRALSRMSNVLDDSLVSVRLRQTATMDRSDFEVIELLDLLVEEVSAETEAKGQRLVIEGRARIRADRRALGSALSNLVRNAVKFTAEGGELHVRVKEVPPNVVIEVEDSCGGLPEGAVKKLFDPFVQLGADRSGFGLGLAITEQVARAHGGSLRVHDLPGKGCVFVLDLPAEPPEQPA